MTARRDTRKEELANKFFGIIMKHFKENKDVAFYADKLCITSKYLTMVILSLIHIYMCIRDRLSTCGFMVEIKKLR